MPGFLSEYEETTTLPVGKGADPMQWWVKVRRYLTRAEFKKAQAALVQPIMRSIGTETETSGDVDTVGYQNELVFAAIVEWNLSDASGTLLPLEPEAAKRASIDVLPEEVFEAISKLIEGAAAKKEDDDKKDGDGGQVADPFLSRRAPRALPRGASAG